MTLAPFPAAQAARLTTLLTDLKLPTVAAELVPRLTQAGQADALPLVLEVLELEAAERHARRIARLRAAAKLPPAKTWATFDDTRLARALRQQLRELATGAFLEHAGNVLAFGLPGVGKSHAACALGHALVEAGHSVLFTRTYQLIQELLAAKRALVLPRLLRKLDAVELVVLDSCGAPRYVTSPFGGARFRGLGGRRLHITGVALQVTGPRASPGSWRRGATRRLRRRVLRGAPSRWRRASSPDRRRRSGWWSRRWHGRASG